MILVLIAVLDPESELKSRAILTIRAHSNVAAETFADVLAQGEAKTHAMGVQPPAPLQSSIGKPDTLLVLRQDTWAAVLHYDRQHGLRHCVIRWHSLGAGRHQDLRLIGGVFHRVRQQIHKDLLEATLVSLDAMFDQPAIVVLDLHLSVERLVLYQLNNLVQNFLHREVVSVLFYFALLKECKVEQVFHFELDEAG